MSSYLGYETQNNFQKIPPLKKRVLDSLAYELFIRPPGQLYYYYYDYDSIILDSACLICVAI